MCLRWIFDHHYLMWVCNALNLYTKDSQFFLYMPTTFWHLQNYGPPSRLSLNPAIHTYFGYTITKKNQFRTCKLQAVLESAHCFLENREKYSRFLFPSIVFFFKSSSEGLFTLHYLQPPFVPKPCFRPHFFIWLKHLFSF